MTALAMSNVLLWITNIALVLTVLALIKAAVLFEVAVAGE